MLFTHLGEMVLTGLKSKANAEVQNTAVPRLSSRAQVPNVARATLNGLIILQSR